MVYINKVCASSKEELDNKIRELLDNPKNGKARSIEYTVDEIGKEVCYSAKVTFDKPMSDLNIRLDVVSGPHGDETYDFIATLSKPCTLKQFANHLINDRVGDWGRLYLGSRMQEPIMEYKHGKITKIDDEKWAQNCDKVLKAKLEAYGGWSLVDYVIKFDEPVEEKKPDIVINIYINREK